MENNSFFTRARYSHNSLYKEDGPYINVDMRATEWYKDNRHHREDGPAIEYDDYSKRWFLQGIELSEKLFNEITKGPVENLPLYLGQGFNGFIAERLKSHE